MPLFLDTLQASLDAHFRDLAQSRLASGLPLFAFEHGLDTSQIEELSRHVRKQIRAGDGRLSSHWLPWIVYASEIGYGYTGEEYWQSFEEQTPGWDGHHRDSLRSWFRKFHTTYHGVEPSGPWATNFPIIAWPITHAILPKYLQYQFARAIHQNRYRLASLGELDPKAMGRLLAAHTDDSSIRFQQFLQQEELTGRILLGLLGADTDDASGPIYPSTLKRVVQDLDNVRATRTWLKDVRTVVAKFKGIGHGSGNYVFRSAETREASAPKPADIDIRPRLFLRHSGGGNWAVGLSVPSLAAVAALKPDVGAVLRSTRTRVAGSTDTKPAGWVLSSNLAAIIKTWPAPSASLLQFEKSHPVLDALLKSDFTMSADSLWLFRIGPDGLAHEIAGRTVRPGSDYILLATKTPTVEGFSTEVALECSGIHGCRISLPTSLNAGQSKALADAGLQIARTISVWPAGLPCRGWDGEGQSQWLTTEEPCLGLLHDHPVSSFLIRVNGTTQGIVTASAPGIPTFIRLNRLPVGTHRMSVTAQRHGSIAEATQRAPTDGFLDLVVREPKPWVPGVSAHSGLIVAVTPHDADLDEFWTGNAEISVIGPESHQVTFSISLERSNGDEIFTTPPGPSVPLPLTSVVMRTKIEAIAKHEESVSWRYPEASVGRLRIHGGELGEYVLEFHRDVPPLRWLIRKTGGEVLLKLADDTGSNEPPECESFTMSRPTDAIAGDAAALRAGIESVPPGALYVARSGLHSDAVVVSHGFAQEGLKGLGTTPTCDDVADGTLSLKRAIVVLDTWASARVAGSLAEVRRTQVTRALTNAIFARVCGKHWTTAERAFLENPKSASSADALQHKVCDYDGFGVVVKDNYQKFLSDEAGVWYAELCKRYKICESRALCDFAIRLTFEPRRMSILYKEKLDELAKQAASSPAVVRGARFGKLLCDEFLPNEVTSFGKGLKWL
ncbi:MAG: hypothetical protein M3N97_03760 [Pseudomonadota bacterium]|nr:hypothetical protein [Pseudomonadota bacterium]